MTLRDPEILGPLLGQRLLEVISDSDDDLEEMGNDRVTLCFENGITVSFPVTQLGFTLNYPDGGGGAP